MDELGVTENDMRLKKVCDAGCGQGRWSYGFSQLGCEVWGVDSSQSAISYAKEHVKGTFLQGDITSEKLFEILPPQAFDLVFCWGVLHHTPNPRETFSIVSKLVKPRGMLHIMVYARRGAYIKFIRGVYRLLPLSGRKLLADFMASTKRLANKGVTYSPPVGHLFRPLYKIARWSPSAHSNFDAFSPRINSWHSEQEVKGWFAENGFTFRRDYPEWRRGVACIIATGVKQ